MKEQRFWLKLYRETNETEKCPKNFNRDRSVHLLAEIISHPWKPPTGTRQRYTYKYRLDRDISSSVIPNEERHDCRNVNPKGPTWATARKKLRWQLSKQHFSRYSIFASTSQTSEFPENFKYRRKMVNRKPHKLLIKWSLNLMRIPKVPFYTGCPI